MPKDYHFKRIFKIVNRFYLPKILTEGLKPATPAFQHEAHKPAEYIMEGLGVFATVDIPLFYYGFGTKRPDGKNDFDGAVLLQINDDTIPWRLQGEDFLLPIEKKEYYTLKLVPPESIALVYCKESEHSRTKKLIPKSWQGILVPVPDKMFHMAASDEFLAWLKRIEKG
jgi:hypothetical protein